MKQDDLNWYRQNGFPEIVVNTAAEIISQVEKYYEMEFDEIFISNVQNNGYEEYPSLWMFTEQYAVECKFFLNRFDIDLVRYKGRIKYVNIITDKYDTLGNPLPTASMKLTVSLKDDLKCLFDAKGINCVRLSGIAKRYLKEFKSIE